MGGTARGRRGMRITKRNSCPTVSATPCSPCRWDALPAFRPCQGREEEDPADLRDFQDVRSNEAGSARGRRPVTPGDGTRVVGKLQ